MRLKQKHQEAASKAGPSSGFSFLSRFQQKRGRKAISGALASFNSGAKNLSSSGGAPSSKISFFPQAKPFQAKRPLPKGATLLMDVGFTKLQVALACSTSADELEILEFSQRQHWAFDESCSVDPTELKRALKEALGDLQKNHPVLPEDVYVSAAFHHVKTQPSYGVIAIGENSSSTGIINESHIQKVNEVAATVSLPESTYCLHSVAEFYKVDSVRFPMPPVGLKGVRLESAVNLVTVDRSVYTLIKDSVESLGLKPVEFCWQPLASGQACLSYSEKKRGVAFVEIRGFATHVSIFHGGSLVKAFVIPFGGESVTYDICASLNLSYDEAKVFQEQKISLKEELYEVSETMFESSVEEGDDEEALLAGTDLMKDRLKSILDVLSHELQQSGIREKISSGIVFSGGISFASGFLPFVKTHLTGHVRLAENQLNVTGNIAADKCFSLLGLGALFQKKVHRKSQRQLESIWKKMVSSFRRAPEKSL